MRKLCLFVLIALLYPIHVSAVDLNIKDPIIQGLEITVSASFSGSSNNYLQGTLRSETSSRYFGETQNNKGNWVDYISSPEKEYITSNFFVTDVQNASWSGQLKLRFKIDDPNYLGPGVYDLKLRRFTGASTGSAGESNTLSVTLSAPLLTPSPSPSPTPTPTISPSPSPVSTPTQAPSVIPTPKSALIPSPSPEISASQVGSVAGTTTEIDLSEFGLTSPAPSSVQQGQSPPNQALALNLTRVKTVILIGIGLIILFLAGFFGYRKYLDTIGK